MADIADDAADDATDDTISLVTYDMIPLAVRNATYSATMDTARHTAIARTVDTTYAMTNDVGNATTADIALKNSL